MRFFWFFVDKSNHIGYNTNSVFSRFFEGDIFMNEIKELREKTGLTQKQFSEHFDIPIGTLRRWEQGQGKPPSYVMTLLERAMREEGYLPTLSTVNEVGI